MKKFFGLIFKLILSFAIIGGVTAGIDYLRMSSGEKPIFNIKEYNEKTKKEKFTGLIYKASRKARINDSEALNESSDLKFTILNKYEMQLPKLERLNDYTFTVKTEETIDCNNELKLYYANLDMKVYTYCLNSIKTDFGNKIIDLKDYLKEDKNDIEDILTKLGYKGLTPTQDYMKFESYKDDFTNNGLKVYRCNLSNSKDVYIGPESMDYMNEFCIYQNDDFKFTSTLDEIPNDVHNENEYDVLKEDDENIYQIEKGKIDYIYLVSLEHRESPEEKHSLREIIDNNIMTIEELQEKGLKINIVKKNS